MLTVEPNVIHQPKNLLATFSAARIKLVDIQRLSDNIRNRHARIEGGIGILEDHRCLLAERMDVRRGNDLPAAVEDLTTRRFVEIQKRASDRGFPTPRFPNQPKRLPLVDREGNTVNRLEGLGAKGTHIDVKVLPQVLDLNERGVLLRALLRLQFLIFGLIHRSRLPSQV